MKIMDVVRRWVGRWASPRSSASFRPEDPDAMERHRRALDEWIATHETDASAADIGTILRRVARAERRAA